MDSSHSKRKPRMNMNVDVDRLSSLPDDLIHKILSCISIKYGVRTCILSSRWRFIWTSMPYLNIPFHDFTRSYEHVDREFVNNVLSRRNDQIEVYSVKFRFDQTFSKALLKQVLDYAFLHNVQELSVVCLLHDKIDFPSYLFRSHSVKCLRLEGSFTDFPLHTRSFILESTWELPALTTLHLDYVALYDDAVLLKCSNLRNLMLTNFSIVESTSFTICHPRLSNLTLEDGAWGLDFVNVVAPQLENLCIKSCFGKHVVTAPNLASFNFSGSCLLHFSTDLPSLEKANICVDSMDEWRGWSGYTITCLLQRIHNVKFLTLNLEFIVHLSPFMEQLSLQLSPLGNLKSLTIYPVYLASDDEACKNVNMSTKVINYLLDGSPSASFRMISYEELKENRQRAQALANAVEAQSLMENLQATLEKEKANIEETKVTRMDCGKTAVVSDGTKTNDQAKAPMEKMHLHFKRKMAQMKSYWKDVGVQIDECRRKTCDIVSRLRHIEALLLRDLPTSKRDELQACFSSLCAEADTLVKTILHQMNIPQNNLNDCFNELVTTSLASS